MRTHEKSIVSALGYVKEGTFSTPDDLTRSKILQEIRERKDTFSYKLWSLSMAVMFLHYLLQTQVLELINVY